MAFKNCTLLEQEEKFQLKNAPVDLFDENQVVPVKPSSMLLQQLSEAERIPARSKKARSELFIMPILLEGNTLYVDRQVYFRSTLPTVLGIFQHVIEYYRSILPEKMSLEEE